MGRPPSSCSACLRNAPTRSQLVQRRRPKVIDQPRHVPDRIAGRRAQLPQQHFSSFRIVAQHVARRVGTESDARQDRAEAIMQIAAQPPALLLPRTDDLFARPLHRHDRAVA